MQVGGYWEAYGEDADWLRERLALDEGRARRGLGHSAGFPVRDRVRLHSMLNGSGTDTLVWIRQTGRVNGNLMERVVHFVQPPSGMTSPSVGFKLAERDRRSTGMVFDEQPLWLDSHKQENSQ